LNNALYRVRGGQETYACKFFVVDERRRAEREWAALCALRAARLPLAPEPVAFVRDGHLPQPVMVCRWVDALPLSSAKLTSSELATLVCQLNEIHRCPPVPGSEVFLAWHQPASYGAYLAEIQASLARVRSWASDLPGRGKNLPIWVSDLPALLPLLEAAFVLAEDAVHRASTQGGYPVQALVRVDGNLDSVVRDTEGRFLFLNWEYSGWGDPAYDLAELRWHPRAGWIEQTQWDAALDSYVPHTGDSLFSERLAVYSQLLPAWWVGRSALHLLEGAGQLSGRPRLARVPARMYQAVRTQLDRYLVALGLMQAPGTDEENAG
jgi:hypothetical protein